jgi:hypothetical protein
MNDEMILWWKMDLNWIGFDLDFVMEWRFLGLEETNQKWIKINKKENTIKRKKSKYGKKNENDDYAKKMIFEFSFKSWLFVDFFLIFYYMNEKETYFIWGKIRVWHLRLWIIFKSLKNIRLSKVREKIVIETYGYASE